MRKDQRRNFLLASSALLAAPFTSFGQPAQTLRRIGYLNLNGSTTFTAKRAQQMLRESLRRAGYEEGKNLVVEWRYADGNVEALPALAQELVRLKVELIVTSLNQPTAAAKRATRTLPIVMHSVYEPVENDYIESLARPGGNLTGTAWAGAETGGKIYQVLREAIPRAVRIASLWNPSGPGAEIGRTRNERIASDLGMSVESFPVTRVEEFEPALKRIELMRPDALIVWGDAILNSRVEEIAAFAIKHRLVSIGSAPRYLDGGGLIYYGPDFSALYDRTASFVDRILRGARPGDLPVELPTRFETVLNAKTARAIGFKPSKSFMLRVDRQVE